jgi:hypothetical protein
MGFYSGSGNTQLANENGISFPTFSSAPSSPIQGQVYFDTTRKKLYMWDGYFWGEIFEPERGFLYRTIITTGYVMDGYQSTSPWKNVNRMSHATDICTNLGDLMSTAGAYVSGGCSKTIGYVFGASADWPGTTTTTARFTMTTETTSSDGTAMNWARNDCTTIFKETDYLWVVGGGPTQVDVMNLTNDTMYSDQGITSMAGDSGKQYGCSSFSDETKAYVWGDAYHRFTFSTSTAVTINTSSAIQHDDQQKGISSKIHKGWAGNEGQYNGGYNLRRWDLTTETNLGTTTKPVGNSGEENFDMGQDHQYMMGCYDGAQNNRGWKFSYTTETGYELGTGSVRTGVPGGSSGACAWKGA